MFFYIEIHPQNIKIIKTKTKKYVCIYREFDTLQQYDVVVGGGNENEFNNSAYAKLYSV